MDDKDYKDLDHFFKSRLNQKDAESTGWDVPSDSILDNALEQVLEPKPKRRFPLGLLLSLALLTILIASFLVLRSCDKAEIENLNKQVALLEATIAEKQELKPTTDSISNTQNLEKTNRANNTAETSTNATITDHTIKSTEKVVSNSVSKERQNSSSITHWDTGKSIKRSSQTPTAATTLSTTILSNEYAAKSSNTIIEKETEIRSEESATHLIKTIPLLTSANRNKESLGTLSATEHVTASNKWSSFITLGNLFSTFNMTNLPAANYSLTDYDKYYSGWELGIGTAYDLTDNNQIRVDLRYNIINNESHFKESSTYISGDELTNNNGDVFYNTNLDISSPIGQHTENLLMDVTNHDVVDGDATENFADIYQKFNTISANTLVSQNLLKSNAIKIELTGGVGFNYFLNARQDIKMSMQHHNEEMGSKSIEVDGIPSMNRFHINGQVGLFIGKEFMNKFYVGLNTGYQRSLTSIRKSTSLDQSKTFIGSFQSGLKIAYHF